jgi:hypothetical protein
MNNAVKMAFAATLVLGSTSFASAEFDPSLANRYPGYAAPGVYGYTVNGNTPQLLHGTPSAPFKSAPVRLHQDRNGAVSSGWAGASGGNYNGRESWFDIDRSDRASSPYAGGG